MRGTRVIISDSSSRLLNPFATQFLFEYPLTDPRTDTPLGSYFLASVKFVLSSLSYPLPDLLSLCTERFMSEMTS